VLYLAGETRQTSRQQAIQLFYKPQAPGAAQQQMDGLYYTLKGRFFFDFVHEDDLGAQKLQK
jgi:hypothetical protein